MRFFLCKAIVASLLSLVWLSMASMPASSQTDGTQPTQSAKAKKKSNSDASINERINRGTVSIVTSDRDMETVNDLARALNEEGAMRVVPILGESAVANVRDILYLRGVDAGILNADVLPYLRISGEMPASQRRIRYVTKLYDKTVFLVVAPSIAGTADLVGKKIAITGETTESGVTAKTVTSLTKLDAELVVATTPKAVEGLLQGDLAGFVAVERDATSLLRFIPEGSGLKIVSLPISPELTEIYNSRHVDAIEAPSLLPAEGVDTLTVPALLSVFDWKAGGTRYAAVASFVGKLISRTTDVASFEDGRAWREMSPDTDIAGWQRFDAARDSIAKTAEARALVPRPVVRAEAAVVASVSAVASDANAESASATVVPKADLLRLVAGRRQPLIDDTQQGGGIVTEIVTTGLAAEGASGVRLTWSADRNAELEGLAEGRLYDVGLAWPSTDCDNVSDLSEQSAMLCDQFLFSEPILQVLTVLFARGDSGFTFSDDESIAGKSVCLPEGADEAELNRGGRGWLKRQTVTLVRAPTLDACFRMVAARDADAVMASEIEGRATLVASGLAAEIEMLERPMATESLTAVVAKSHPAAEAVVGRINAALARVKANGGYYTLVDKYLVALWGAAPATR
ncbi:MAG: transporter substrate-binding domain-containing protein [Hyphomicrobiaceae bacterium]